MTQPNYKSLLRLTRSALCSSVLVMLIFVGWGRASSAAEPPITALEFAPDGETVMVGSQRGIEICSWPDLEVQDTLDTYLLNVNDLKFSPDGKLLAAVGGAPGDEGVVEMYNWPDKSLAYRVTNHEDLAFDIAWRPDGLVWCTVGLDNTARIHDAKTGDAIRSIEGHSRGVVVDAYLPDNETLITGSIDQSLRIWNSNTGEDKLALTNHTAPLHGIALRPGQPEGSLPVLTSISEDRTVRLWQPTIGRLMRFVRLSKVMPLDVVWTVDGRYIAVSCSDGQVRIIDPDYPKIILEIPAIDGWAHSIAAHPKGDGLLVGGEGGQLKRIELTDLPSE